MVVMRYVAFVVVLLMVAPFLRAATPQKPNVLFIAIDDLRPELGCYGAAQIKSPNIDALAKRGVVFNRAYCQQAVCSPSRISLMTGRRPDTTKIYDLITPLRKTMPDVVTLPQQFKNHGYHAAGFGKIYHGGLDDAASWSVPHTPNRAMQYGDPKIIAAVKKKGAEGWEQGGKNKGPAWEAADVADDALPDGYIADKAIEALRAVARAKDKPFFLAVGFEKPHLPFVAPRKYFDLYPPAEQIKLPEDSRPPKGAPSIALTNWAEMRPYDGIPKKGPLTEQQSKELIRAYDACVSYADAQVGRLLDELDRLQVRDNTIVILWGDHGYQLLEQGLWCKHTNFENSTRVPLIISAPGQPSRGGLTNSIVELVDVYPTLCELAGLPTPNGLEGTSLAPLLRDPSKTLKTAAFSQYPRQDDKIMGYSIRTIHYRYTEWQADWKSDQPNLVARELYDHQADPRETMNVVDQPQHAAAIKQLSQQLKEGRTKR
ncbi:MAG: iduronate 2-sulfatase [Phycisphaerales bacterium]|jgi:arylsulfatase A-like enzyme|nr:iduronate 2-sulfatase [Phycisphaerales bacterium]